MTYAIKSVCCLKVAKIYLKMLFVIFWWISIYLTLNALYRIYALFSICLFLPLIIKSRIYNGDHNYDRCEILPFFLYKLSLSFSVSFFYHIKWNVSLRFFNKVVCMHEPFSQKKSRNVVCIHIARVTQWPTNMNRE